MPKTRTAILKGSYTAILKGYTLRVFYVDGSRGVYDFSYGEERLMDTMISGWLANLNGVDSFMVSKNWSAPGETVSLKVKQQGE